METVSVGMLLPSSSIRPMGRDFERAFKKAIEETLEGSDYEIDLVMEFITAASMGKLAEAMDKFFGYHSVDAVTGILSTAALKSVADKFEKRNTPLLINNVGEHLISNEERNPMVFLNSIHLWQQAWQLGHYAVSNLGKKGCVLAAVFDSGYAFLPCLQLGMQAVDEEVDFDLQIMPWPADGGLTDINAVLDILESKEADFVVPLFCGEEASLFLEGYKERGLEVPIVGLPFLLETGDKSLEGVTVYTPRTSYDDAHPDPTYKQLFSEYGRTSGKVLGQSILEGKGKINPDDIEALLKANSDQFEYRMDKSPRAKQPIAILKNTFGPGNELSTEKVYEQNTDLEEDEDLNQQRNLTASSWLNPYLGV